MIINTLNNKMPEIRKNIVFAIFFLLVFISSFFSGEWSDWLITIILFLVFLLLLYSIILYKEKKIYFKNWKEKYLSNPNTYLILLLLVTIIASYLSINRFKSFNLLFLFLAYVSIYYVAQKYFNKLKRIEVFLKIIFYLGVLVSLIAIGMFIFQNSPRANGLLFNANALGSYLLFSLPAGLVYLFTKTGKSKIKIIDIVGLLVVILAFVLTLSYTGFVSFFIPLIILIVYFRKKIFQKKNMKYFIAIFLVTILMLFFVRLQNTGNSKEALQIYKTISFESVSFSFNQRFEFDIAAIKIFIDNIWSGTGYNTYQSVYGRYAETINEQPRYAHNYYLQMLSEIGIFGFTFLISFIILILKKAKRLFANESDPERKKIFLIVFLGLLGSSIHSLFDFGWQFPAVFMIFWILAGMVMAMANKQNSFEIIKSKIKVNELKKYLVMVLIICLAILLLGRGISLFASLYYSQQAEREANDGDIEQQWEYLQVSNKYNPNPSKIVDYVQVRTKFDALLKEEDYIELENKMKSLININDEEYYAHWMLGQIYTLQKKYTESIVEYNKAIELAPLFRPDFYYDLAYVYYQQENYFAVKKTIYSILEKYPEGIHSSNPNLPTQLSYLYLLLGQVYDKLGNNEKAIENINTSLRYVPDFKLAQDKLNELQ